MATTVHLKPKAQYDYRSLLRRHVLPRFGNHELGRIDRMAVRTWIADLEASGLSASRIRQARQVLSSALAAAVEAGFIAANPAAGVKVPRARRREKLFLTAEQVEVLANAIDKRYTALVYLLAYGGLRWGEAVAVRHHRLDLKRSRVEVAESMAEAAGVVHFGPTRTYECRTVVLPAFVRDQLAEHLVRYGPDDVQGLVFRSRDASRCGTATSGAVSGCRRCAPPTFPTASGSTICDTPAPPCSSPKAPTLRRSRSTSGTRRSP